MPTVIPKPKGDKKKKLTTTKPKLTQLELPDPNPGQRIQAIARAFRLKFHDTGSQRRLDDEQVGGLVTETEADSDQLRLSKMLYCKHPAVTAKTAAKSRIVELFRAETLPYPEPGVRLFPVRAMDQEAQVAEVNNFIAAVRMKIEEYHDAVRELANNWDHVLAASREKLKDLFDPKDYPTAEKLIILVGCDLEPYNLALPDYFKSVAPEEYAKAVAQVEAKFSAAADMQCAHVTELMTVAVDQLVHRIKGFHDGKQRSFKDSAMGNVFAAFEEFRTKTRAFGILTGSPLERLFERTMQLMKEGANDEATLPTSLRTNPAKREDFLAKATDLRDAFLDLTKIQPRRHVSKD